VGPGIGALLIAWRGEGWCFLFDGFSYLAVLGALLAMRVKVRAKHQGGQRLLHAFKEGFTYSFGFAPIRAILLLVALTSLLIMPLSTLMPMFADQVLGGRERMYGVLLVSSGVGAFAGTMYLAWRRSVVGLGRVIAIANAALGAGMIAFSASRHLGISVPILFVTGGSLVVQMAAANTVLQTIVDDHMRGRVMSLFSMCFMGITPFGSMLAGYLGTAIGPVRTLAICGGACIIGGGLFALRLNALRPLVRPIYVRRGVLPEVAEGVQSTAAAATTTQE
jgi:hypothetical protein